MRLQHAKTQARNAASTRRYEGLSIVQLAERIVDSDRLALKELHDARPLFRLRNGKSTLLARFVERLCDTRWAMTFADRNRVLLEDAYDLTIDKYAHIPANGPGRPQPRRRAPDCRNAFKSFLCVMDGLTKDDRSETPVLNEILAAKILQRRVVRSFQLSCLDARRRVSRGRSRYAWRLNGSVIYVWMPAHIQHLQRRAWLEENIPDVNPARPGERSRVQGIIDERLGAVGHVSIGADEADVASHRRCDSPVHILIEQELQDHGLAKVVADEKAASIDLQRPAIRALGKSRLKKLILRIFENLAQEAYEEKRLADAFGVSRATFTRFAGSRWEAASARRVPDLWANTAQTLATHGPFMEAAQEAGVWDNVELILANRQRVQSRSRSDV